MLSSFLFLYSSLNLRFFSPASIKTILNHFKSYRLCAIIALRGFYGFRKQIRHNRVLSTCKRGRTYQQERGILDSLEAGKFDSLSKIHKYLFEEIYPFAGEIRNVNIAKGNFRFAPVMYLKAALEHIDKMPQSTFEEIIDKYVEMNVAHPFRDGNGRSTRIWLDLILKKELEKVVDWSIIDKEDYLLAMERSPIKSVEIRELLREALTPDINNRTVYMKGIDASYNYEGYFQFNTEEMI